MSIVVAKVFHHVFQFFLYYVVKFIWQVLFFFVTRHRVYGLNYSGVGGQHTIMIIDTRPEQEAAYFTFDKFQQIDSDYFIKGQK